MIFLAVFLSLTCVVNAQSFNYSVIHRQAESICVGWGTPPFYDFSDGNGSYVPYFGATQTVDLNTQDIIMGNNLTMQTSTTTNTTTTNCTAICTITISGNGSVFMDGTGDYVPISGTKAGENLTIEGWIKPIERAGNYETIFSTGDVGASEYYWVALDQSTDTINVIVRFAGAAQLWAKTSITWGEWQHFAFSVNSTGNHLYIDGAKVTPTYDAGNAASSYGFNDVTDTDNNIGSLDWGGDDYFYDGNIDELRIYNRTLTQSEIYNVYELAQNHNLPSNNSATALRAYWNFNADALDYSGNGNGGTLEGNAVIEADSMVQVTTCVNKTKPVFWAKLEDLTSEIGKDLLEEGTAVFSTGKYGLGANVTTNNNEPYIDNFDWDANTSSGDNWAVDFWVVTPYSVTDGEPSDGVHHGLLRYFIDANNQGSAHIYTLAEGNYGVAWEALIGGATWDCGGFYTQTGATWAANTPTHLAFVFNNSGIDGTPDKCRLYINGILVGNDTTGNIGAKNGVSNIALGIGWAAVSNLNGVIDNIKIWNYAKTNWSDRNTEGVNLLNCTNTTTSNTTSSGRSIFYDGLFNIPLKTWYAEMWNKTYTGFETVDLVTSEVYVPVKKLVCGSFNGFTCTNMTGNLTATKPGLYYLSISVGASAIATAGEYGMKVFKNGAGINNCYKNRQIGTTVTNIDTTCFIRLAANDTINLRFDDHLNPVRDIKLTFVNFNLVRIAE